ncbi:hypothetical protein A5765_14455 [Mycolicibacterium celeriflavum]|uniref:DUF427 domain-containing protein n=1 Tax=Mycolicibacterium celeriflavum TaxID=1249101 RepID=UPI0007FF6418|nr:DUF427 domain-containing protein [Mycolicibacterium celeriflavum]OBG12554.1 hypothetical protein A5765_14455 [Mycolicibacterium celeriflavum]
MGVRMSELLHGSLDALRYEPTPKRIRISLAGEPLVDTGAALLVWEPRRIVPTYAVPVADLVEQLVPAGAESGDDDVDRPGADRAVLDPTVPFGAHTCPGVEFDVIAGEETAPAAAFRPDDADLADYVVLEFGAFEWLEEDEPIVSHPHDPFHRIDVLASSRHVRIESDGHVLAESKRPLLLFETHLPVRFYLPRDDVLADLDNSDTISYCAYKGRASYFSVPDGPRDVAWTYRDPLPDGARVRDRICFFDERVDVTVDGVRRERPAKQWS